MRRPGLSSLDFNAIGDRQKTLEQVDAGKAIMPGIPVLARLDGRGFHNFTKGLKRPFDERLSDCMQMTAMHLLEESCATIVYTQSDEITLCWKNEEDTETKVFFGGKFQKLCSVLAATASNWFNGHVRSLIPEKADNYAVFDCRVWQVPNLRIAAENFLWREMDARKNAVTMAAHSFYSNKDLHGVHTAQKIELLRKAGVNFADYPTFFKKGTYYKRVQENRALSAQELERIPEQHRPVGPITRNVTKEVSFLNLTMISNLEDVLFRNVAPIPHSLVREDETT